jgi:DNA-binding LytR/AlgR family response regulator
MRRVQRLAGAAARVVTVQTKLGAAPVLVSQIQYAEVYSHETILHLSGQNLTVVQSLSALEELLGGAPFLRCYRSYIVNMDYVEKLDDNDFVMKSGVRVPIARDGKKGIQSHYMDYVFGRMEGL